MLTENRKKRSILSSFQTFNFSNFYMRINTALIPVTGWVIWTSPLLFCALQKNVDKL